jgi:hypothetical protein
MKPSHCIVGALLVFGATCGVNGAEYYVGPNGNDSAAGSEAAPWASINSSLPKLKAGDTLLVLPGSYKAGWNFTKAAVAATKEAYVTVRSKEPLKAILENGAEAVTFTGECGFVRLDGFKIAGASNHGVFITGASHDIEVSNCEIAGCRMAVKSAKAHDLTFRKLNMHHNGYGMHLGDKNENKAHRMLIEDCTADTDHKAGNVDGFCVEDGCSENLVFRRCVSSNNEDAGFDVKPEGAVLENCVAFGNKEGFKCWRGSTLINCAAWGNGAAVQSAGQNVSGDPKPVTLIHCTLIGALDLTGPVQVVNSIVAGRMKDRSGKLIEDYNLLTGGAESLKRGAHSLAGEPAFVDPAKHDYHLKKESLAFGKGTTEFPEVKVRGANGETPVWKLDAAKTDVEGKVRPASKPALGAYE